MSEHDDIDDELAELLEGTDVDTDSLRRIDTDVDSTEKDDIRRLPRDAIDDVVVDEPVDDDITVVFAGHLVPENVRPLTDDDVGFYDGQQSVTEGRVMYDVHREAFCVVCGATHERADVTVAFLEQSDDGPFETAHGTFSPTGETEAVHWPDQGGRFVPK